MFKLRGELGFLLYFVVMQQTIFFFKSCRNKLRDKCQQKMPSVPQPITGIKREFPTLFLAWGFSSTINKYMK